MRKLRWALLSLAVWALLLDGRWSLLPLPSSRALTGGTGACAQEEAADPPVPALRAAWWWLWQAWGRREARAAGGELPLRRIVIDTEARRLTLWEGQQVLRQYPVAVGKPSTPTPPGEWRVVWKSRNWGGGFGTRWMGLNVPWGIYGIHGTNQPGSIGTAASSGCVRMFNRDVEELFELTPMGTPVVILGPLPAVEPRARPAPGSSGQAVLVLQVRLRQAGFSPGPIDGRFGAQTEQRVRQMQGFYGFPVTGVPAPEELRLLRFPR